jgi:hypothetical protein
MPDILTTAVILAGALLYIEIGARLVRVGVRRAPRRIGSFTRVTMLLFWPIALVYGVIAVSLKG